MMAARSSAGTRVQVTVSRSPWRRAQRRAAEAAGTLGGATGRDPGCYHDAPFSADFGSAPSGKLTIYMPLIRAGAPLRRESARNTTERGDTTSRAKRAGSPFLRVIRGRGRGQSIPHRYVIRARRGGHECVCFTEGLFLGTL